MKSKGTEKSKRMGEVVRFVITGGVCFLIELAALKVFRDVIGLGKLVNGTLNYGTLIATAIAFLISVIVNYLMCVRWVFDGAGEQGNAQRAGFLITSVIGFFLNLGLMWLFGKLFQELPDEIAFLAELRPGQFDQRFHGIDILRRLVFERQNRKMPGNVGMGGDIFAAHLEKLGLRVVPAQDRKHFRQLVRRRGFRIVFAVRECGAPDG